MLVQDAVSQFCRGISEHIDDACIQYLSGIVDDACEQGDTDVADVEELVQGFLPDFAKLPQQERHERLWSLLTQVHALHESGNLIEPTGHDARTPSSSAEEVPATIASGPQQCSRDAGNQSFGSLSRNNKYSEDHEQAISTLSALWPPEVPMDKAFLEAVLETQCQGNLEAAGMSLLECPDLAKQQALWQRATQEDRKRREAAAQKEKEARKNIISKFSLEAQHARLGQLRSRGRSEVAPAPWSASQPCVSKKGVRYRDGFAVASKGEKHIEVPCKEDWNGGSAGKVYTKGKRGKGFV